jgi:peptidoglycan/LPS O-acetylase OafA/YrhL
MKRELFLVVILLTLFVPIVAFAQGVGDIVKEAGGVFTTYVLPVIGFLVTNVFKNWIVKSGSKAINVIIAICVAACLVSAYFLVGSPSFSWLQFATQLFGSMTVIWGFVTAVKEAIKKIAPTT